MTPEELVEQMREAMTARPRPRRFAGGLLPAFCQFLLSLEHPARGYAGWDAFLSAHPQVTGPGVNTLTVLRRGDPGAKQTIRPHYNAVAQYFVIDNDRPDFPSAAPHATGQWHDYLDWLDALVRLTPDELREVDARARAVVLDLLPEETFDPAEIASEPRLFEMLIRDFPWADRAPDEKTGAAFQALVFAYIRANAPHLQVEARKVRTGSARQHGVGDVDGWDGRALVISAEVKHFSFVVGHVDDVQPFIRKARKRRAHTMVVALDFAFDAAARIVADGAKPVAMADVLRDVENWDARKQKAGVLAFEYAVARIERSPGLLARFDAFMAAL